MHFFPFFFFLHLRFIILHPRLQQVVYRIWSLVGTDSEFNRHPLDLEKYLWSVACYANANPNANPTAAAHHHVDLVLFFWPET